MRRNMISAKFIRMPLKSEFYTYNAEVMIFGHTHAAGTYPNTEDEITEMGSKMAGKPTLLINTGSWVKNIESNIEDCFAYIDNSGVALLEWDNTDEKIYCKKFFPAGTIKTRTDKVRKI